jgi:hypothetical protein
MQGRRRRRMRIACGDGETAKPQKEEMADMIFFICLMMTWLYEKS